MYAPNSGSQDFRKGVLLEPKSQVKINQQGWWLQYPTFPNRHVIWAATSTKSREISELNDIIQQLDLGGIYRIFHPNTKEYTFYSGAQWNFVKINHTLRNKTRLYKSTNTDITPCIYPIWLQCNKIWSWQQSIHCWTWEKKETRSWKHSTASGRHLEQCCEGDVWPHGPALRN